MSIVVEYHDVSEVPVVQIGNCDLIQADCLDVLRLMLDNTVDAICIDPPAGIEFMGKEWDSFKNRTDQPPSGDQTEAWDVHSGTPFARKPTPRFTGKTGDADHVIRAAFVAWLSAIAKELFRVLKPGGHAFVWALPRTSHWTAWAFEDASFECRGITHHAFASGFPKSLDVSRAIDKAAKGHPQGSSDPDSPNSGKFKTQATEGKRSEVDKGQHFGAGPGQFMREQGEKYERELVPEAVDWIGWGTSDKPAIEHWHLFRKPLSEPNVAANVLKWGTGAINVDGCRVRSSVTNPVLTVEQEIVEAGIAAVLGLSPPPPMSTGPSGRWPANLVLSHAPECVCVGTRKVKAPTINRFTDGAKPFGNGAGHPYETISCGDENGEETVEVWACVPGCPVRELDEQSGFTKTKRNEKPSDCDGNTWGGTIQVNRGPRGYTDAGGASRFFNTFHEELDVPFIYQKKPSPTEKHGVVKCTHPTVKSIDLCRHLCRLICPPGGIVLDCFLGSGTTGLACVREGFQFIGIEIDPEYFEIAKARIEHEVGEKK